MSISLKVSFGDYDRTHALLSGEVKFSGIEPEYTVVSSPERHKRMLRYEEFDICELSLSSYLIAKEYNKEYTAIPVFPHQHFRHGYIFVRPGSSIKKPDDLAGKRIAVGRWQNTAAVWVRGILEDYYGVKRNNVQWFTLRDEDVKVPFPKDLKIKRLPDGLTGDQALLEDKIDALIVSESPNSYGSPGGVVRLITNYKEVEKAYYKETGIIPLMHTIVIRNKIIQEYPWIVKSVWQGFNDAKQICYKKLTDERSFSLLWHAAYFEEEKDLLGSDPWPYDIEHNKKAIEALARYLMADGMLKSLPDLSKIFLS